MVEEKSRNWYKNLPEEGKDKIKESQRQRHQQLIQYKKDALQNKLSFVFTQYKNEWQDTKIWQY